MIPIKQINEWSLLHNTSIIICNKPSEIHNKTHGFSMSNKKRHIRK